MKTQPICFGLCLILAFLAAGGGAVLSADERQRPSISVESDLDANRLWIDVVLPDGQSHRRMLRVVRAPVHPQATGWDPKGRAGFATWNESGVRWFSYSRDAGRNWSEAKPLQLGLKLRDGEVNPDDRMPDAPHELRLPPDGGLYLVQLKTISLPEWRAALEGTGARVLAYVPNHAHIVRLDGPPAKRVEALAELAMVERVEPYHPWYRLSAELRAWLDEPMDAAPLRMRVRVVAFEWGAAGKHGIAALARDLGAEIVALPPSGHVVELKVDREQLVQIAAHDEVEWIDPWAPPSDEVDRVREDSGTDWVEDNLGYCGQGVRGEVMDSGISAAHPDFESILLHGPHDDREHGTNTYGIVFGRGYGNPRARGVLPCGEGIFADYTETQDRYAHTAELKQSPYLASFQTNSWGHGTTPNENPYTSYASDMDDIIWRLDIAILSAQGNSGTNGSTYEALAKNIISVGGVYHEDTLETDDDVWAGGASVGPTDDGRIKPDVSYWYDGITTTTSPDGYTYSFNGTSAATPQAAGVLGLMLQMWKENVWGTDHPPERTVFEAQPHFSTLKALLINNTRQYPFDTQDHDLSRHKQGWGRPSVELAAQRANNSLVVDQEVLLEVGELATYRIDVAGGESELKVTMVYPDPPGNPASSIARVNDLDLRVISPSGEVYLGNVGLTAGTGSTPGGAANRLDTVENVFVVDPEPGIWSVAVDAVEVNEDACPVGHETSCGPTSGGTPEADAMFSLVVTGGTGTSACAASMADFTVTPDPARVGEIVQFDSTVEGGAGAPYTYSWDFDGDGVEDSTDADPMHVYGRQYDGEVRLWLFDAASCPVTVTRWVTADGPDLRYENYRLIEYEGNGNGGIDPGETWELEIDIRNDGNDGAIGVTAGLSVDPTTPGTVTLLDASSTYGDVGVGETASSGPAYRFRVGGDFPCGEWISFNFMAASMNPDNTYPEETGVIRLLVGGSGPGVSFHADGFEDDSGWTIIDSEGTGEWERGSPAGMGTAAPDPTAAYEGDHVWGNDLTGRGDYPGDYENSIGSVLRSPWIDVSADYRDIKLKFQRWLNVAPGDRAQVYVLAEGAPSWIEVPTPAIVADDAWTPVALDISHIADGATGIRIDFRLISDGSTTASGWNIDALEVVGVTSESCDPFGPYLRHDGIFEIAEVVGNGDGGVDPGETFDLRVSLRNDGSAQAAGVSADISIDPAAPGPVTLIRTSSAYPDLGVGQSAPSESDYRIRVGPEFPCGGEIGFNLTNVTSSEPPETYAEVSDLVRVVVGGEDQKLALVEADTKGDHFGSAVSISGDLVVVGSRFDDEGGADSGAAVVFRYDPFAGRWVQESKLMASAAAVGDRFGSSVSISGDMVVIGAPRADAGGAMNSGAAYVFRYNDSTGDWVEQSILTATVPVANDEFGRSVSISDNAAVVGAYQVDEGGVTGSGVAYVFRHDAMAGWIEEQKLTADVPTESDRFGYSVSISGDVIVVGTPLDDESGPANSGAAYVFRYDHQLTIWAQEQKLLASTVDHSQQLGWAVSTNGDEALIGAPWHFGNGASVGAAYLFRHVGSGNWVETQILTASDPNAADTFGYSVSIGGDLAVVGVPWDDERGTDSGAAYLFRHDSSEDLWIEEQVLTASDGFGQDRFGFSVATDGERVAAGAPYHNDLGVYQSGSAYVFTTDETCEPCTWSDLRYDSYSNLIEVAGNGDGDVDPGEIWEMTVHLRNDGCGMAYDVSANIAVDAQSAGSVHLLSTGSDYPDIDVDEVGTSWDSYRFRVGDDFPCGGGIVLSMTDITSTDPGSSHPDQLGVIRIPVDWEDVTLFYDGFEGAAGWAVHDWQGDGEWEFGMPQGLGGPQADPTSAYEGQFVLGNDLTGLGLDPGNHENDVVSQVVSPFIEVAGYSDLELRYAHWLNMTDGDLAAVTVWSDAIASWAPVYEESMGVSADRWETAVEPISAVVGDAEQIRVQFRIETDGATTASGWNIDAFELRGLTCEAFQRALPGEAGQLQVGKGPPGYLTVQWSGDCGAATTFGIYRGDLRVGYDSIAPVAGKCNVTTTSHMISDGPADAEFLLVVPHKDGEEGSYGADSSGTPRPPATNACHPQGAVDVCAP